MAKTAVKTVKAVKSVKAKAVKVQKIEEEFSTESLVELFKELSGRKETKSTSLKETEKLIELVGKIQRIEKKLSLIKNPMKEEIKTYMIKHKKSELPVDVYKAMYSEYEKTTFDQELFKEEHPKMFEKYQITKDATKFEVKDNK